MSPRQKVTGVSEGLHISPALEGPISSSDKDLAIKLRIEEIDR